VLPTGLGKTPISILLAAHMLEKYPDSKILVLAPTKPLTNQHYYTFLKLLNVDKESMQVITGLIKPETRESFYNEKTVIFATPQTIQNDLRGGRISLKKFSLLVADEAHHSIGKYSYPFIAKRYMKESENPRILGLTASPGGTHEKIQEICENLGIETIEIRTEKDSDVTPYVKEKQIEGINVELPESFIKIRTLLNNAYMSKLKSLRKIGFSKPVRYITKSDLLKIQAGLRKNMGKGYKSFFGISLVAQAIKIEHALGLLETQGITVLEKYWKKLRQQAESVRAAKSLIKNKEISDAMWLTHNLFESGSKHPKISKLCSIVDQRLRKKPDSMIIIFANFRDSVKEIVSVLKNVSGARPISFVGQREGITQKEQIKILNDFKEGLYNVLVATSVGEEGIDIPDMDLAM
jgi:Fanconi anemia group M protein